ncbi:MAG: hypothetical protein K6G08_00305 [Prevotella sp.]|nr:hypothetical protein [Prevotella sp.]
MTKRLCMLLLLVMSACGLQAQDSCVCCRTDFKPQIVDNRPFRHLDLSLTAGTTGIGIDVASPINDLIRLRAGFSWMPPISPTMHFGVQVGDDASTSQTKFDNLAGKLESFTGYKVDNQVDMKGVPTYYNFNLMVDFTPLRNKNWHFTAGLYLGPSRVAKAYNTTEDMPSLMAVGIYNNLYDRIVASPILTDPDYFWDNTLLDVINDIQLLSQLGFDFSQLEEMMGSTFLDPFNNPVKSLYERIRDYGRMGIHIGDYRKDVVDDNGNVIHPKGSPYMVEPNDDSMVKAWVKVNRLKPYLGFGYGGRMLPKDDSWRISFDAGVLFWGGTPKIVTHDGTDLVGDVTNVHGKVGRYVDIIEKFKVFPVLNLRITKRLF